jgi:hypothetical protein
MAVTAPVRAIRFGLEQVMEAPKPHSRVLNSRIVTYGAPVLATILATVLRMALAPVVGAAVPFVSYFLATLLLAWYSGFRAAVLSILLSTIAGTYFSFLPQPARRC